MERNSLKQMLRMPVKTVSFLALITAMGFLISLALGMFVKTSANIETYQSRFKTIGTVRQLESSLSKEIQWDAGKKDYEIWQWPEYGRILPVTVLDFEGAEYIHAPEKRNFYGSYSTEYKLMTDGQSSMDPVVEFSPLEDCVPDHSVRIKVTKVLAGPQSLMHAVLWYCDHYTEKPDTLYQNKTYVAALWPAGWTHGELNGEKPEEDCLEYYPVKLAANSYDSEGKKLQDKEAEDKLFSYYERTDDFYKSPEGKRYLNYCKSTEAFHHTFPVTGTSSTELLLPFYLGNAGITDGRDISEEAYAEGLLECLIPETFARRNNLKTGDKVKTQLYYTNCENEAAICYGLDGSGRWDFLLLMDDGVAPEVFETKEYTVVGIYSASMSADSTGVIGGDEMIVPANSITNKDKNILAYGPMKYGTTSFEIPNGSIDKYMKKWEALGIEDLEITFYDKGYTKLEKGMKNMRFMSVVFGAVGVILGVTLLIFYSRMFIGGQKVRITMERCMGVTNAKCRRSLLTGAMLVLLVGSLAGCTLGTIFAQSISVYDMGADFYDTAYSNGKNDFAEEAPELESNAGTIILLGILCEIIILAAGYGILQKDITSFLRQEPLYLLDDINTG